MLCWSQAFKANAEGPRHWPVFENSSFHFPQLSLFSLLPFQSEAKILYLEPLPEWFFLRWGPKTKKKNGFLNAGRLLSIRGVATSSLMIGEGQISVTSHLSLTDLLFIPMAIQLWCLLSHQVGEELYKWDRKAFTSSQIFDVMDSQAYSPILFTQRTHTETLQTEIIDLHVPRRSAVCKWQTANTSKWVRH